MRRRAFAISLWLVIAAAAQGQSWKPYSNQPGSFSVMLPADPTETSRNDDGVMLHTFKVTRLPRQIYMVIYSDYPIRDFKMSPTARLNAERDEFVKHGGRLISEHAFKFRRGSSELPALEFYSESGGFLYKSLAILDGSRVYFVCAGMAQEMNPTGRFKLFFDSFTLN
jgi:hypothetical protein